MGKVIAIVNQKGGVGKTTTSINLATSLGLLNKKTLLIDLDPQGNATTGVGINKGDVRTSVYDVLIDSSNIEEVILKTRYRNLRILPATLTLVNLDSKLTEKSKLEETFNKGCQLKKHLEKIKDNFDFIIIDCPPSLGILTTNALTAADSVLIPVQCEFFALEGIMQLINTVMMAQKKWNPNLDIEGVLLTMFTSKTNLGLEVIEEVRGYFKERVYNTIIPRLIRLAEAPSHGKPICDYDPKSKGTEAYLNLAKEVIERNAREEESLG